MRSQTGVWEREVIIQVNILIGRKKWFTVNDQANSKPPGVSPFRRRAKRNSGPELHAEEFRLHPRLPHRR